MIIAISTVTLTLLLLRLFGFELSTTVYSQLRFAPPSSPSPAPDSNNDGTNNNASTRTEEQQQQIEGFSTYEDPTSLFTNQYPLDWKVLAPKAGFVNIISPSAFDFESGKKFSTVIVVVTAHKTVSDSASASGSVQFNAVDTITMKNGKKYLVSYNRDG